MLALLCYLQSEKRKEALYGQSLRHFCRYIYQQIKELRQGCNACDRNSSKSLTFLGNSDKGMEAPAFLFVSEATAYTLGNRTDNFYVTLLNLFF